MGGPPPRFAAEIDDPCLSEYFEWLAREVERRMDESPRAPACA
jgi:hypothetical protein